MRARMFDRNVPLQQHFVQGQSATRNALLSRTIKADRTIQPGNTFNRQIRTEGRELISTSPWYLGIGD